MSATGRPPGGGPLDLMLVFPNVGPAPRKREVPVEGGVAQPTKRRKKKTAGEVKAAYAERKRRGRDDRTSSVKTSLSSVLVGRGREKVRTEIEWMVRQVSRATYEASKLFLILVVRAHARGEDIPAVTDAFVDNVFRAVSVMRCTRQSGPAIAPDGAEPSATGNACVDEAAAHYRTLRPPGVAWADRTRAAQAFKHARTMMITNAKNHVDTNRWKFTARWVRSKLRSANVGFAKKKDTNRCVYLACKAIFSANGNEPGADDDAGDDDCDDEEDESATDTLDNACNPRAVTARAAIVAEARAFLQARDLIDQTYGATVTAKNWYRWLPWFCKMLDVLVIDARACEAERKGSNSPPVRRAPKLFSPVPIKATPHAEHVTFDTDALYSLLIRANHPAVRGTASVVSFRDTAGETWARVINVRKLETQSKEFARFLRTDGVSASVTMRPRDGLCGQTWNVPLVRRGGRGKKVDAFPRWTTRVDLAFGGADHANVVGVDPGRRDLYTASNGRRRSVGGVASCSTRGFRARAGYGERMRLTRKWEDAAHPHVAEMRESPSAKTTTLTEIDCHVRYGLERMDACLSLRCSRKVRKLAFTTYCRRSRALSAEVKRIVALGQGGETTPRPTVVAFGDAMFSSVSRGNAPGPVRQVASRLAHFARQRPDKCALFMTSEFRTSQVCSKCGTRDLRGPLSDEDELCAGWGGIMQFRPRRRIHGVRACQGPCRTTWNRDVNAAHNIRRALIYANAHGGERPKSLRRPPACARQSDTAPVFVLDVGVLQEVMARVTKHARTASVDESRHNASHPGRR